MLRLTVTTILPSKGKPGNQWFNFETDFADLAAVYREMTERGCIFGYRVTTNPDQYGRRVVTQRRPHILGVGVIAILEPLTVPYVEPDEHTVLAPGVVLKEAAQ